MESFQTDLQVCDNRGVSPRMFRTELLINSPMNERVYRETHRIETEASPDGARQLVVSTASFSRREYEEMNSLRRFFILCYTFGILREVAHFVRSERGLREIDFYERLRCDLSDDPERWPTLAFSVRALPILLVPPTSWHLVVKEVRRYLLDVWEFEDDDAFRTVLAVQHAVLPCAVPKSFTRNSNWHTTMWPGTRP